MAEGTEPQPRERALGKSNLTKTKEEDDLVLQLVKESGAKNWSYIAKQLPGRIGKQCRERWHNHLNPEISKDRWTDEEDEVIIQAHKQ